MNVSTKTSEAGLRPCVFLDRDGVINEERHYVHTVDEFHLLPGVPEALARLQSAGYALVVVTNQGGIGLGLYDEAALDAVTAHLRQILGKHGVTLDGVYHCPHHPRSAEPRWNQPCDCRKPAPGMLLRAAAELGLDLKASMMVGDKGSDMAAAQGAGVPTRWLVRSGHALDAQDLALATGVFDDLPACVDHLLGSRVVAIPSTAGPVR